MTHILKLIHNVRLKLGELLVSTVTTKKNSSPSGKPTSQITSHPLTKTDESRIISYGTSKVKRFWILGVLPADAECTGRRSMELQNSMGRISMLFTCKRPVSSPPRMRLKTTTGS